MGSSSNMLLFELGMIKLGNKNIACEEITISTSQENNYRYVSDQVYGMDVQPTKKKIDFTLKKPKVLENDILFYLYTNYMTFDLDLYRIINPDDANNPLLGSNAGNPVTNTASNIINDISQALQNSYNGFMAAAGQGSSVNTSSTTTGIFKLKNGAVLQHYITLNICQISQISFGNFDGTKTISEDIQGSALYYSFDPSVSAYYDSILNNIKDDFTI